jgi:hypothetical protein
MSVLTGQGNEEHDPFWVESRHDVGMGEDSLQTGWCRLSIKGFCNGRPS